MTTATIQRPLLGVFTGRVVDGVEQYIGVQYATVKDRLSETIVRSEYGGRIEATKFGPASYGAPDGFEDEVRKFIQCEIPKPDLVHSDIDCLNLRITVPTRNQNSSHKLPVFVWIHGGGFVVGAASWPHYDQSKLVKLAADNGVPIIGVGLNYRLGVPGFLISEELRTAGYKGNNFLRDQRAGLEWVRRHISGFGGDPNNITVVGESAGAIAVTQHLLSHQPIFQRAFVTGGTCLPRPPLPVAIHESNYQQVCAALGLDELSPEERIKALLNVPMEEVMAKVPPSVQPDAIIDDDIIGAGLSYSSVSDPKDTSVPAKKWLKALAIGDSKFDASVLFWLMSFLRPRSPNFSASTHATLASHPEQASRLLSLYGFGGKVLDEESAFLKLLEFINDTSFTLATLAFAKGFAAGTQTHVFFFNEPNPWPGEFTSRATHALDVVFLFQNYNDKLPPAQRKAAENMGVDFARFVSGEEP